MKKGFVSGKVEKPKTLENSIEKSAWFTQIGKELDGKYFSYYLKTNLFLLCKKTTESYIWQEKSNIKQVSHGECPIIKR